MKKLQQLKSLQTGTKFLLGAIIFSVSTFIYIAIAAPPSNPYNPGETLNPACSPGDTNCTVLAPLSALNNLTTSTQAFAIGTTGTDFAIISSGSTHTFNLPSASALHRGLLTATDWTTFNSKEPAIGILPIARGGTGLSTIGAANTLLGVVGAGGSLEYKTLDGTTNQIIATNATGSIILSLPQNIHTTATPTFAGLTLSGATPLTLTGASPVSFIRNTASADILAIDNAGAGTLSLNLIDGGLQTLGTERLTNAGALINITSLNTHAIPSGTGTLAISATAPITLSTAGIIGVTSANLLGTANQVSVTGGTGVLLGNTNVTLSLPQNIHTVASPTFAGLTLSGLTAGRIPFAGTGGLITDDAGLFWDNTNKRVGIGTTGPTRRLAIVDAGVGLDRPSLNNLAFYTGDIERMRIDSDGNIGIGTTAPSKRLDVVGDIQNITSVDASPIRVGAVTLAAGENNAYAVAISGRYAYLSTNTAPARVVVMDISNPISPTRVGAVTLLAGEDNAHSIAVSGRYAYVSTNTTPARVVVVDISNPASPARVGAVTLLAGENSSHSIVISGAYAYLSTNTTPARVVVVDVSNPASPTRVGAVTLLAGEDNAHSIAVSGRYAYVSTITTPARVVVVDISNPASPTRVGAVTLAVGEDNSHFLAVSGRYAYVSTSTTPARVVVVDISNPVSPTRVGAVTLATGENDARAITVSGRYAYVSTWTSPIRVMVVDISNPASPIRVGAVTLATGENEAHPIVISGRYAYVSTNTTPARMVVVDIRGIETTSLIAHSLESGNLQVRQDLNVNDQLRVGGGLNVGIGGIFSAGSLALVSNSTGTTLSALDIRNSAGTPLLFVRDDGNVGIGTTTPGARKLYIPATVAGAHPIATAWNTHSDIALKANIRDLNYGLEEVLLMKPRSFDFKIGSLPSIGFVAQELEPIIPEVVSGEEGQKGISIADLTAVLTKAIQELAQRVENIEEEILAWLPHQIVRVRSLFVQDELCIGQTCLNEGQIKAILEHVGAKSIQSGQTDPEQPSETGTPNEEKLIGQQVEETIESPSQIEEIRTEETIQEISEDF